MDENTVTWGQLIHLSRLLERIVEVRAAFAPFCATVRAREELLEDPQVWRRLSALWRPCQERLDLLLDVAVPRPDWAVELDGLRRELEGGVLDEAHSPAALEDAADAFDGACERLLARTVWALRDVVAHLETMTGESV
ncbi:MAG: hypothetical protein JXD18_00405 [Anaerolineae bacterium]|nr:hypothetical protein [Anaerolineae bacterium]